MKKKEDAHYNQMVSKKHEESSMGKDYWDVACEKWYSGVKILHNTTKWVKFNEAISLSNLTTDKRLEVS